MCGNSNLKKIKSKIQFPSSTSHISVVPQPHVASDSRIIQGRSRTFHHGGNFYRTLLVQMEEQNRELWVFMFIFKDVQQIVDLYYGVTL